MKKIPVCLILALAIIAGAYSTVATAQKKESKPEKEQGAETNQMTQEQLDTSHKLYWAKELSVAGFTEHTLNYDIRALGRRGVLSLNAIASMEQLKTIEKDMQQVLGLVEFNEGHRYGDYVAGMDKVAAYGIGGLIAGKILAKVGLFKLILGALVAGKKFVIIALIALAAFLKKLLWGRKKEEPEPTAAE